MVGFSSSLNVSLMFGLLLILIVLSMSCFYCDGVMCVFGLVSIVLCRFVLVCMVVRLMLCVVSVCSSRCV